MNRKPSARHLASINVEDPYDPGKSLSVAVNRSTDAIVKLGKRLTQGQRQAADAFQRAWEIAAGQRNLGIDYGKPFIDKMNVRADVSVGRLEAFDRLRGAAVLLGNVGFDVVVAVACEGMSIKQVAVMFGRPKKHQYYGDVLRDSLESLAREWGYSSTPVSRTRARVSRSSDKSEEFPPQDWPAYIHSKDRFRRRRTG